MKTKKLGPFQRVGTYIGGYIHIYKKRSADFSVTFAWLQSSFSRRSCKWKLYRVCLCRITDTCFVAQSIGTPFPIRFTSPLPVKCYFFNNASHESFTSSVRRSFSFLCSIYKQDRSLIKSFLNWTKNCMGKGTIIFILAISLKVIVEIYIVWKIWRVQRRESADYSLAN